MLAVDWHGPGVKKKPVEAMKSETYSWTNMTHVAPKKKMQKNNINNCLTSKTILAIRAFLFWATCGHKGLGSMCKKWDYSPPPKKAPKFERNHFDLQFLWDPPIKGLVKKGGFCGSILVSQNKTSGPSKCFPCPRRTFLNRNMYI